MSCCKNEFGFTTETPPPSSEPGIFSASSNNTQPTTNSDTTVGINTVSESENITLSNDEITISSSGDYSFELEINWSIVSNLIGNLEIWMEEFDGLVWNPVPLSGCGADLDVLLMGITRSKFIIRNIVSGRKYRIRNRATSLITLPSLIITTLTNGIVIPSAKIIIFKL